MFDKSMDATIASRPILMVRVLPSQQVMARGRNSVKIDDSFYLSTTRLPSVEVEFRMGECGRATRGVSRVSRAEVLIRQ